MALTTYAIINQDYRVYHEVKRNPIIGLGLQVKVVNVTDTPGPPTAFPSNLPSATPPNTQTIYVTENTILVSLLGKMILDPLC